MLTLSGFLTCIVILVTLPCANTFEMYLSQRTHGKIYVLGVLRCNIYWYSGPLLQLPLLDTVHVFLSLILIENASL